MKAKCPHCQNTQSVNPLKRLRDVSCSSCHRLVFREERMWGKLWTVFCVLAALAAGVVVYQKTADIRHAWSVYIVYLVPAAVVLLLAPLGNLLVYVVHRLREK